MARQKLPGAEELFKKGKQRHSEVKPKQERITLYMSSTLWRSLEDVRLDLYEKYGIKTNKSRIICASLEVSLAPPDKLAQALRR